MVDEIRNPAVYFVFNVDLLFVTFLAVNQSWGSKINYVLVENIPDGRRWRVKNKINFIN